MNSIAVLDKNVHSRLIQELDQIAAIARIPASMIRTSSKPYLTKAQQEWVKTFRALRAEGKASAYMVEKQDSPTDRVMMAMAAVLIRNFVDARVYSLASVIEAEDDSVTSPSVIFIPNFFNTFHGGKPLAAWQVQKLYSTLLSRFVKDKVTVVYVEDMDKMQAAYGSAVREHVEGNYRQL
jgi:hypothetical protein